MERPGFANAFPNPAWEEWRSLAEAVLKGADFEKKLVSTTRDGIRIEPLYAKADAGSSPWRAAHGPWSVVQRVDHPDPGVANQLALADLAGGADGLVLVCRGAVSARGFGLKAERVEDVEAALAGVMLDLIRLRLDAGAGATMAATLILDLAERRGHDLAALDIDLGIDPIGVLATEGSVSAPWPERARSLAVEVSAFCARGFRGRALVADGRPYHEAGGSEGQELAAILATALAYLRALEAGGIALETARDTMAFLVVADADEFLTVAKLRALRRLWAGIERACGLDPKPVRIHAETAWRMTTRRDPWVNLLRTTLAVFSAGIGGADSVTVLPFTAALGLPDSFARRLARNTQAILIEESNLWRVADPVAGAGAFEALTEGLVETGWRLFQEIEREGGIVASLEAGLIQGRIATTRVERARAIAIRREAITGTSEFPDIREAPVAVLMPFPPPATVIPGERSEGREPGWTGRKAGSPSPAAALPPPAGDDRGGEQFRIEPLPSIRVAEPFEALRDRADAILSATGARPQIFLANLGPIAAFSARATFAKNAFEAGGIEALGNDGFASPDALVAAFATSGARLACLCSSDDLYARDGAEAAAKLKAAGCLSLCLAGRPGGGAEQFMRSGIDRYIHAGSDLLATLHHVFETLEALPHPQR